MWDDECAAPFRTREEGDGAHMHACTCVNVFDGGHVPPTDFAPQPLSEEDEEEKRRIPGGGADSLQRSALQID